MHANTREEIKEVRAGDIAAAVGLKKVTTGDTLCDPDKVIILRTNGYFQNQLFQLQLSQKPKQTKKKWVLRLGKLAQEDPSFRVHTDEESGQTIIAGMGELHLKLLLIE